MIGLELISDEILSLEHTDTGDMALQWMNDFKVSHLSVLKNGNFVGVVSENELYNQPNLSRPLTEIFNHLPRPFVRGTAHIYEVFNIAALDHLSVVPVLDENENFLGNINIKTLLHKFASTNTIKEQGGIIVLEMSITDYSLAHISQVIESENAKVLSSFITSNANSKVLELTLKINRIDLGRILRALERYDYKVKASFQRNSYHE